MRHYIYRSSFGTSIIRAKSLEQAKQTLNRRACAKYAFTVYEIKFIKKSMIPSTIEIHD